MTDDTRRSIKHQRRMLWVASVLYAALFIAVLVFVIEPWAVAKLVEPAR